MNIRKFECDLCKRTFKKKDHLNNHLYKRKTKCVNKKVPKKLPKKLPNLPNFPNLPKKFPNLPNYDSQMTRIDSRMTQFDSLYIPSPTQMTLNDSRMTPTQYECNYCNRKFTRNNNLTRHLNNSCKIKKEC